MQYNAYFSKGCCLHKLNRLEEAILDLKKATDIQPDKG